MPGFDCDRAAIDHQQLAVEPEDDFHEAIILGYHHQEVQAFRVQVHPDRLATLADDHAGSRTARQRER
jgi:hypothetical protein